MKGLVWCGGDVTSYIQVDYIINDQIAKTFLAPAALHNMYKYDKLAVMIPETLFASRASDNYKLLLQAKSQYNNYVLIDPPVSIYDPLVHSLLEYGFNHYVIPHPGIASPMDLIVKEKKISVKRSKTRTYKCSFNLTVNLIYRWLIDFINDEVSELHIDLTHGSNIMVTALMISGNILQAATDLKVKFWCAPILARPVESQKVEVLDITEVAEVQSRILSGAVAWKMIDERILPTEYFRKLGKRLGPKYGRLFSDPMRILNESSKLLWGLRSGQAIATFRLIERLKEETIKEERTLINLLNKEFPQEEYYPEKFKVEICKDPPWIPIVHVVIKRTKKLINNLYGKNGFELMSKILRLYKDVELYDKIISIGREWLVFLILRNIAIKTGIEKIKCGIGEWELIDGILRKWARVKAGKEEFKPEERLLIKLLKLEDIVEIFDKTRATRNRLMHGRLSREDEIELNMDTGRPLKELEIIKKDSIRKYAEELLKILNQLNQ